MKQVVVTTLCFVSFGCVTPTAPSSQTEDKGGYFVAVAAESSSEQTLALYDGLHDAIDGHNRRVADKEGRLAGYVEAFESDGYARMADGRNEIECDLKKCLVKLVGKTIAAPPKDDRALATQLTLALAAKGVAPIREGAGDEQQRTYILGDKSGLHVTCVQKGLDTHASYRCDFELVQGGGGASGPAAAAEAAMDATARGKLVNCALSPGTVRSAQEARDELDQGELVELKAASGKAVGFLRVSKTGPEVEFVDVFLCGDLSHDHFIVEGAAKSPKTWLKSATLETIHDDDVRLEANAAVTDQTTEGYTVEVSFKIGRQERGAGGEVYGEDRFLFRVPKVWVQ